MTLKSAVISQSGNRWEGPSNHYHSRTEILKNDHGLWHTHGCPLRTGRTDGRQDTVFLGRVRRERHHPLANRGRKPFINSEAEQRGSFRGVDLALKPYRPLSSRPVRRRLNTVHSRPPPPHPRRMHAALLARIPQVLDFKESPAGVWGKKEKNLDEHVKMFTGPLEKRRNRLTWATKLPWEW